MFEIHVGELRATFLRNHNMRRHKDPSRRQPKQKTVQAEDNSSTEDPHKHGGAAPVTWRCTRYVAVHPNRRGALPTDRVQCPNTQEQTRNWHGPSTPCRTPPCAAGPYRWKDEHSAHAAHSDTCTPAHSDTSHTLRCEEPDLDPNYTPIMKSHFSARP